MSKREYVIISSIYDSLYGKDILLFWGKRTKDDEERSFVGYESDINKCEIYTEDEIKNSQFKFKKWDKRKNYKKMGDFYIKISQLKELGCVERTMYFSD